MSLLRASLNRMARVGGEFMPSRLVRRVFLFLRAASTSIRAPREREVLMTGMERADSKDERGGLGHVGISDVGWVVLLGPAPEATARAEAREEVVVSAPCGGVEQVVLADQEDASKLLEVVGHHDVLGGALAQVEQGVNVLDAAEGFLPELELNSDVQLHGNECRGGAAGCLGR